MKKQRADGKETRQRLLEVAGEVFAEKGFWETTNADICEKAKVNTAAVNYHFNSKEDLYVESWKYAFKKSIEVHPPDSGISPEASIKERLKGRILSFMHRIADPKTYDIDIIHKEMACPTGLLTDAIEEATEPLRLEWEIFIREILGERASERQIHFCNTNITSMCFGPLLQIRHSRMGTKTPHPKNITADVDVDVFAEHTTCFIMEGLLGIREKLEKGHNCRFEQNENRDV